uniref:Polyphosphate kinase n=2 Tax=environmental samples TaxID=48479 RepID=C7FPK8_9BACT|nr:polyphosphate kinase [uncultured bacterium HF186_25m_18N5]ACU26511.1 polyphosphate kinase [uncultured bacterium HF186_25m_27D22]
MDTDRQSEVTPRESSEGASDLSNPDLYIHPELSRLAFNERVLAMAVDDQVPLLERLRFLTIASTNMDEFFEVRVAGLVQQIGFEGARRGPDGLSPEEAVSAISARAQEMVSRQYKALNEVLLPALAEEGIDIVSRHRWNEGQKQWAKDYFETQVLPVLTPTGLDPGHPFPNVRNKSLHFIVSLKGKDAFGRPAGMAVVPIPRCLPRLIPIDNHPDGTFVLLSSVIHAHINALFPGMRVTGCHQFRVTRNSDLWVDEEAVDDLLHALRGELSTRAYGDAIRLEIADTCDEALCTFLLGVYGLDRRAVYKVDGPVNLHRLEALYELDRPELKYAPMTPTHPLLSQGSGDIFQTLRQQDILLHHPYEGFRSVIELIQTAAADSQVLAIKQTLYRTSTDSSIVSALVDASRAGKEVTAVVEIRARFDEAANIDLASRLKEAGVHVVYGVVGYKTHAKMMLIVRREEGQLRRYVHLSTGNYHQGTARFYTDLGFMTCDTQITEDVHKVFLGITSPGQGQRLSRLIQSPFSLQPKVLELIDNEAKKALAGEPAHIIAKLNNLSDPELIQALYRASQAGVVIDLLVRTICCLRPGISGTSETISVRSVVGRFLEHSRVYYFLNGGDEKVYLASADWMPRNLYRRVEIAWPLRRKRLKRRVVKECLKLVLKDNTQAWTLDSEGEWQRQEPGKRRAVTSQVELVTMLTDDDTIH